MATSATESLIVDDASFDEVVLGSRIPVLVDFWAPWCGPCKLVSPIVEAIGRELSERLVVAKLNIDENTAVAQRSMVFSIPTLILYRAGKEAGRWVGFQRKDELARRISAALG
jgi:thioredoxin 1